MSKILQDESVLWSKILTYRNPMGIIKCLRKIVMLYIFTCLLIALHKTFLSTC